MELVKITNIGKSLFLAFDRDGNQIPVDCHKTEIVQYTAEIKEKEKNLLVSIDSVVKPIITKVMKAKK